MGTRRAELPGWQGGDSVALICNCALVTTAVSFWWQMLAGDCEDGCWLVLSCGLLLSMPGTGKNPGCVFLPSCASWAAFPHRLHGAPGTNAFMKISASSSVNQNKVGGKQQPHSLFWIILFIPPSLWWTRMLLFLSGGWSITEFKDMQVSRSQA